MVNSAPSTISILGSTGSIGTQTLEVIKANPELYSVGYLTANANIELLEQQALACNPAGVAIANEDAHRDFVRTTRYKGPALCGREGILEAAAYEHSDVVMSSLVGFSGVEPTLEAIKQGAVIALANKETLVSAGQLIMNVAREYGASMIPVDSEHSAIQQCLVGERIQDVEKLIITASGGPFRKTPAAELRNVTPAQALRHPNWVMGAKITIDSSTLMNKGFEVIEARWLFDISGERIDVTVHPESIVHSMVQFIDGSVKAQLGLPDMKIPIQYALSYPHRLISDFERLDIADIGSLHFSRPDFDRFPCLRFAFEALAAGGTHTTTLNAANEVAVEAFLNNAIPYPAIARCIEEALDKIESTPHASLSQIIDTDRETRAFVTSLVA